MKIRNILSGREEASSATDVLQDETLPSTPDVVGNNRGCSRVVTDCGSSAPPVQNIPEIEEDVIELTISEVDRQTAGPYQDGHNCLICTALRNRGYNVQIVGGTSVSLESNRDYAFDPIPPGPRRHLHKLDDAGPAPFLRPLGCRQSHSAKKGQVVNIFTNLIQAAQDASDFMTTAAIGSQEYEMGVALQVALGPFREKEADLNAVEAPTTGEP